MVKKGFWKRFAEQRHMQIYRIASDETTPMDSFKLAQLTPQIKDLMRRSLVAQGFDIRGKDDFETLLKRQVERSGSLSYEWAEAYRKASGSASAASKTRQQTKEEQSKFPHVNWSRLKHLGKTDDIAEAGYLAPDGTMIDMSGKRERGSPGKRAYDHREIGGQAGMKEAMAAGYIRMSGQFDGHVWFHLLKKPTEQQIKKMYAILSQPKNTVALDMEEGLGEYRETMEENKYYPHKNNKHINYGSNVSPVAVLREIAKFYGMSK